MVGAHKTASTHLQQTLLAARETLAARGVALIGPRAARVHLKPRWQAETPDPAAAAAVLHHLCPGAGHVVILEENILGTTARGFLYGPRGALYPWGVRRLAAVLALFPGTSPRVGLAIREQGSHLASCWAEQILHGPWQPFRLYAAGLGPGRPQWSSLARRLAGPAGELTVWRYEDHRRLLPRVIDWATGLPGLGATLPPAEGLLRAGPSEAAVRFLERRMAEDPARDHRLTYRRVRMRWPRPDHPPFQPWTPAEAAGYAADYAEDLRRLAADPAITLLTPDEAPP